MAKATLAAALVALGSGAAAAADILPYDVAPAGRPYWQGAYVGANLGYQWGDVTRNRANPSGVMGGLQAGYTWQYGQFVFGGETDVQASDADDMFAPWKFSNPWFGTLRARAGMAAGNALFYGTIGLAYGTLKMQNTLTGVSESHTNIGWAGGFGTEVALVSHWTAKVEYLYVDLNNSSYVIGGTSHGINSNILRIGVNYRF